MGQLGLQRDPASKKRREGVMGRREEGREAEGGKGEQRRKEEIIADPTGMFNDPGSDY